VRIYILTREINAYDQDGEYYVTAFKTSPSITQLRKYMGNISNEIYDHMIINGGGRLKTEHEWFNLRIESI
jgi:hypothetical protein